MNLDLNKLLDECDKEPIHIAGAIQNVGFLLLIDKDNLNIIKSYGQTPIKLQSGNIIDKIQKLSNILTKNFDDVIYENIFFDNENYAIKLHYSSPFIILEGTKLFNYWGNEDRLLEKLYTIFTLNKPIDNIYYEVCKYIKQLTNFERVMLYKFDEEYNGSVVGEDKIDELYSYLNHHFPASDIPSQARALYLKNKVRFIADVNEEVIRLDTKYSTIDMSELALRAVSPMHIEYLKNMNVRASMSISIIVDEKLWGLVACHNSKPHNLSLINLKTLSIISQALSREFLRIKNELFFREKTEIESNFDKFLEQNRYLDSEFNKYDIQNNILPQLSTIFKSDYCALFLNNEYYLQENINKDFLLSLKKILDIDKPFYTNFLSKYNESYLKYKDNHSGLFSFCFGENLENRIYFFRKEKSKTLKWAGKPAKDLTDGIISPRKSFETWEEKVVASSNIWEESVIETSINIIKKNQNTLFEPSNNLDPFEIISQAKNSMILTGLNIDDNPIIYVNQAFCELYGYEKDEVIGKNPRFLQNEDREQNSINTIRQYLNENKPVTSVLRNYTKDGNLKYIEISISPIFSKTTNEIKYFLGIQKDVTKEQKILQSLKKMF